MKVFGFEPAIIIGLITAVLTLLVNFGVPIATAQAEAIKNVALAVLVVLGAWATRQQVISVAKVDAVGGVGAAERISKTPPAQIMPPG
jgi:hypothetical protein